MSIIDYLLRAGDQSENITTLIVLFGVDEFLTALQYNTITIEESIAYLTIN